MRIQLAWTMLTELLVLVSGLLILKLAASLLGPAGFGEYALSRRAIALLYLPLVLGLGIAAPRYIAIARIGAMPGFSETGFATATLTAGLLPSAAIVLLLNLFPGLGAIALFGSASLARLVPPATIALAGIALHSMVYSVYRGRSEMNFANVLQVTGLAVVPVAAFLVASHDAPSVLTLTGIGWLLVSGTALFHVLHAERAGSRGAAGMNKHLRVLLKFGLPRVPGEFALVALFGIPSLLAVRAHGVVAAGQFSAALSLLTLAGGVFAPVGLVILPRASAQAASGDIPGLRRMVRKLLAGGILLAIAGVVIGELVIPELVRWYFGAAFLPAIPYFRTVLLGAIPYSLYILMRNVLDALDVKAVNSRNLLIALGLVVVLCLLNRSLIWMSFSVVGSLLLLGAATMRDTWSRLRPAHVAEPVSIHA